MPDPVTGITAGVAVLGATSNASAVRSASRAESDAANAGIGEQRRQFDQVQALLAPFVEGGTDAFGEMMNLSGGGGIDAQQQAIAGIEGSPEMAALVAQGENAILQNASATGGLRGGNTQASLAQFRPQVLSGLINQQYSRLGGIAQMGQNSAAGVGAAGQSMANNVANLQAQRGQAQAGGALGQAAAFNQGLGTLGGVATGIMQNGGINVGQPGSLFGNSWGGF